MDISELGFVPVAAIVVLCFLVGLILGVVGRTVIDGFPATDPITAAAIGVVSGLAATGAHQIYKQLSESIEDDLKSAGGEM